MSFFTRSFYDSDPSFTPLFRLLDEFDNYTREARGNQEHRPRQRRQHAGTFNPRFDVRETDSAYELHGEFPGVDRDKIQVEFTDPQTIVIRGRAERNYTAGTPPAGLVEGGGAQMSGAITEKGEEHAEAGAKEGGGADSRSVDKPRAAAPSFEKYWVQERSVGEFVRTFSFPTRVDLDAVSANLNNGILSLVVPKAKKHDTRRITIN